MQSVSPCFTVRAAAGAWALLGLLVNGGPAHAEIDRETQLRLAPSVMKIEVLTSAGYGLGSGVLIGRDELVTNCHVTRRADFVEQPHRPLFEQTGADATEHIVRGLALEDDVVDAVAVQLLSEQQSRRPRANDRYFCPQGPLPGCYSPPVIVADLQ